MKFRKQHPFGDFVLDFYYAAKRVAVEVDGMVHEKGDRPAKDSRRDAWLDEQGVHVLRVPAIEVLRDPTGTAETILAYCADRPPPSAAGAAATSPRGGGLSGVAA